MENKKGLMLMEKVKKVARWVLAGLFLLSGVGWLFPSGGFAPLSGVLGILAGLATAPIPAIDEILHNLKIRGVLRGVLVLVLLVAAGSMIPNEDKAELPERAPTEAAEEAAAPEDTAEPEPTPEPETQSEPEPEPTPEPEPEPEPETQSEPEPTPEPEPEPEPTPEPEPEPEPTPEPEPEPEPEPTPTDTMTKGQRNALGAAEAYLRTTAFSYEGLIHQLEYSQYSTEDATYGADNCGADWNEQALKKAKEYLNMMAFSHSGLIHQLEYEKFTSEQAQYGADNCGADWNEQAAKKAKEYENMMSFSRDGLIGQLEYEGFTTEQATYGADANGY
ncbi:MAG: Ltp family lipoprotein [Oscillibacter sp.]|nr:Ltp family lipoprotein [Oscillibacter sp.]